ncbi:AraC family transcriptional regulator [Leptolyngbya sp. FACHB-261]|uniref:AraC family transcriptional regulator n=1 Tax=Leptolyngbya sp. FACHB-261 TaxID=2692806 RepID=UPI00168579BE|nr:helix-turn-helix domain-containing protein [Leptolyngbya sp. FACHB-261]MBD2104299.1 AraC family transcriptional regulator [Leptolyngbya sp. FACHB-261]
MAKASQTSIDHKPKLPIVSSQTLGWEPILVEEFQEPPGGVELQSEADPTIVLSLTAKPNRLHQVLGDRRYTGLYRKGDIAITPAGLPSAYKSEGDDHYLFIQIPSSFLQQVAREAINIQQNQLELVPEFRVRHPQIEQILMLLRLELHQGGRIGRLYIESLANALVVQLLRNYSTAQPRVAAYEGGLGDRKLLQVTDYINDSLDQDISLADLAQLSGMSQSHFSQLFRQSMGISPHQYLLQQRIERAKQLLKQTDQSVADIALACGFNSHSHLSKQFRQFTGITPKAYRTN